MSLPLTSFLRSMAVVFAVALAALPAGNASAAASVDTYVDQAVPPEPPAGVLPEGMEWNKPVKPGSLVLPRKQPPKPARAPLTAPKLPVGSMQAPKINAPADPPLFSSDKTSSASVMLLEGMKNALQKSGLNKPKSNLQPVETAGAPTALKAPAAQETPSAALVPGVTYEPGRAPRNLDGGMPLESKSMPAAKEESAVEAEMPRATDLDEEPLSLDQAPSDLDTDKTAKAEEEPPASSIFGPAVSEKPEETADKAAAETESKETTPSEPSCESKTTSWVKACGEAGYPAGTQGKITGETRVECPGGKTRDVWLTNECASGDTRATELKEEPKALDTAARVDANCGAANGLAASGKPAADLCAMGSASDVSGEGPWRWSCKGANGGMTVSCAASVAQGEAPKSMKDEPKAAKAAAAAEDGKCGAADGAGTDGAPTLELCAKGIASRVNGGGPWTWACSGTNGGQAVACKAPKKVDGACGVADKNAADAMPERDLCAAGFASAVTGDGPWNWTCSGLYGGAAATCSAAPKVNAVCGPASLSGHRAQPTEELCKNGTPSVVEGEGPWRWTCSGTHGGADVSCKAPTMVDGVCGAANGGAFDAAPKSDLCAQGQASRVSGLGPWNWNCSGQDNGATVSCTASLVGRAAKEASSAAVACGNATETAAFQTPSQNLCAGGKASAVSGNGPWTWSCSDEEGHNVACSTLMATEGACGTAANVAVNDKPSSNLCASGTAGDVKSSKDRANWTWDCKGSMGAATVACSAPITKLESAAPAAKLPEDARCGTASGHGTGKAPTAELCAAGKASAVRGSGPWTWTCSAKSGNKATCEAPKWIDAVCGSANGTSQKAVPLSGLCAAGSPTEIDGNGPWLWSCVGEGGGSSVSCSAAAQSQTKIDGACGVAASAVMATVPAENLCDTGIPSTVHGEGPWTWTCSGLNGGVAATCTTTRVMPKAPPPPGPPVNGNCGPANGVMAFAQPMEGLCSSGTLTAVSGSGPWNWNCLGENGGMTVSCTAPLTPPAPISGVCGVANGITTLTPPKSGLCSAGISSAVSGRGPWTWSCSGTNGGGAVSCVAPLAGAGGGASIPSIVTPSLGDVAPAPSAAPAGLVTPRLPAGPLPPLESGTWPQLKPSKPLDIPLESSAMAPVDLSGPSLVPPSAPELPKGTEGLMPPPMRESAKPAPSLKPPSIDAEGKPRPGARFTLPSDVSTFSFSRGAETIDNDAYKALDRLSIMLLSNGNVRISLMAYASTEGSSPREARRLSLARALAVRDYLASKGVSSGRVDVRALGANVPSGDMDRVDVKVN